MASRDMTIGDICTELVQWRMFRRDGLTADETAALMNLGPTTAGHYERTLAQLGALKTDAAPGQARPRTADNTSE
jgi:hypothetical protein